MKKILMVKAVIIFILSIMLSVSVGASNSEKYVFDNEKCKESIAKSHGYVLDELPANLVEFVRERLEEKTDMISSRINGFAKDIAFCNAYQKLKIPDLSEQTDYLGIDKLLMDMAAKVKFSNDLPDQDEDLFLLYNEDYLLLRNKLLSTFERIFYENDK